MAAELIQIGIPVTVVSSAATLIVREIIAKLLEKKNGNHVLTESEHKALCEPVKESLIRGETRFQEVFDLINENHRETVNYILELTREVSKK